MTPTNEMPLNVWCELRSSHPTERFVCIYTEPAKGRTKYLRATPDKVMVDRAELERVLYQLKWADNSLGCIKDAIGGTKEDAEKREMAGLWRYCIRDEEQRKQSLQILEAAMKGE